MRIAVASGKGGTGKTTVATNLAQVAADLGRAVAYVDCDVEEPNGHIFLDPTWTETREIGKAVPQVDRTRCTQCGRCGEICQFSAIVCVGEYPLVFPELCHACGGCQLVCPEEAIEEVVRPVGELRLGDSGAIQFVDGVLNVGQHMSPPAIRAVNRAVPEVELAVLDAPPGTSCPAVEAARHCDLALLVTEPTPFGLNDLKLAVEMLRAMKLPLAVIVNRSDIGNDEVRQYCANMRIPILAEFPFDRAVAEAYAQGQLACREVPGYRERFAGLLSKVDAILETR